MNTLTYLRRQLWVKENLIRARRCCIYGYTPLTLRDAGAQLGCDHRQIGRWEDPNGGAPEGKRLDKVVRWMEKRLGIKAPE
jgi:hypothetical protein